MGVTVLGIQHNFYPRSPCGERRKSNKLTEQKLVFLSTLSLRRATVFWKLPAMSIPISIHALLAESDQYQWFRYYCGQNFYPRSPCGERPLSCFVKIMSVSFLSTLSLRRATPIFRVYCSYIFSYFYPRSPCGERRGHISLYKIGNNFYPRSPCGERLCFALYFSRASPFLSTLSLRRATF